MGTEKPSKTFKEQRQDGNPVLEAKWGHMLNEGDRERLWQGEY